MKKEIYEKIIKRQDVYSDTLNRSEFNMLLLGITAVASTDNDIHFDELCELHRLIDKEVKEHYDERI